MSKPTRIADDGFEFFGGTVNTKYLVSAFNDDDASTPTRAIAARTSSGSAIQEQGKRDNGGEWNGEPNGVAVSNAPIANFEIYNATWIGRRRQRQHHGNHGLTIREYSAPRVYNSILTDFTPTAGSMGVRINDTRSGAMLTAGLLDLRENIVHGFPSAANSTAAPLFSDLSRSNTTVNPLLVSISRTTNALLDPRLQPGSPALVTGRIPSDAFFARVPFKGAFMNDLWVRNWTALSHLGFLPNTSTEIFAEPLITTLPTPEAPALKVRLAGSNIEITRRSAATLINPSLPAVPSFLG